MSLLICTPMYNAHCTAPYFKSALNLQEELLRAGVEHDWLIQRNESLITRARMAAVAEFLKTRYRCLLFIDGDIEFEPVEVSKLWNLDAPVAVGAYPMKQVGVPTGAWVDGELVDLRDLEGPTAVDYAGTGFMMVKREVFERLMELHPNWEHETKQGAGWGFFQDPLEDGIHLSEDYFFCKRAREAGFEITLEPSIRLKHWGMHGY